MRDEIALHALAVARDDLAGLTNEIQKLAVERILAGVDRSEEMRIAKIACAAWRQADDAVSMITFGGSFEHGQVH